MINNKQSLRSKDLERGVSLIESLMVVVAMGAIVLLMVNLPNVVNLMNKSNHLSTAREIALKQLEDERTTTYGNLATGTVNIADSRISLLPQGSGTVTVSDCDLSICTNSEHIKKVTVIVLWKDNNKQQNFKIDTFIGEGGLNQ